MTEIQKIPTNINGLSIEEPFLKFKIGNPGAILIVKKEQENYSIQAKDPETEQIIYPETDLNGEFWKSKRKTGQLVKDLKLTDILPEEINKDQFRIQIAKELNQQLELWTEKRSEGSYEPINEFEERYSEKIRTQADTLLEQKEILKHVKEVLDFKIAGEDRTKLGLFLQLLTKDFEEPLMIYGIQKQGEGKSYVANQVIDLFPDHMVEKVTDATKSGIYRIAESEGKDYFDGKIVFFGEIPENEEDRDVFQIFRELVSEGEVSKRLTLESGDGYESKKLELEGAPVMISTTVDPDRIDDQDLSRGVTYSPSMREDQYKQVREYQNVSEELPEEVIIPSEIETKEKIIKCAIDKLSQREIKVKNPFTRDIDQLIPDHTDNIKRDYPKVLRIVGRVPTYLYHEQRTNIVANKQKYYLTEFEDVIRGLVINRDFINGMIEGRIQSTLDAYQTIKDNVGSVSYSYDQMESKTEDGLNGVDRSLSFENSDLQEWMGIAYKTAMNYTRRLDRMGLIYKDKGRKPNKHYLLDAEVETEGITPRSLLKITASVIAQKHFRDWFRALLEFCDIKCKRGHLFQDLTNDIYNQFDFDQPERFYEEGIFSKQGFKDALPPFSNNCYQIDTTLELLERQKNGSIEAEGNHYPHIPLYRKNSRSAKTIPKSLNIGMEDSLIFIELQGVSEEVLEREEMEWQAFFERFVRLSGGSKADLENTESVQNKSTMSSKSNEPGSSPEMNSDIKKEGVSSKNNNSTRNKGVDDISYIKDIIKQLENKQNPDEGIEVQTIIDSSELTEERTEKIISKLKGQGKLWEPSPGRIKTV